MRNNEESLDSTPLVEKRSKHSSSVMYRPHLVERGKCLGCCLIVTLVVVGLLVIAAGVGAGLGARLASSASLSGEVTESLLMDHLTLLQNKTIKYGSRSVLSGYNASGEYVEEQLNSAGYSVTRQYFTVGVYEDLQPDESVFRVVIDDGKVEYFWDFLVGTQFSVMRYSGNTGNNTLEAPIHFVEGNGSGCSLSDFDGFPNGSIALLNYSIPESELNCTVYDKAHNAESSGAVAVVMGRSESEAGVAPPRSRIYVQNPDGYSIVSIPVLGATYGLVQTLTHLDQLGGENLTAHIRTYTSVTHANTFNLFAETSQGMANSTIVVGSHLDSVPAGLGINDNGSGSMANLVMALLLKKETFAGKIKNRVKFAFWGAEELGLLGSRHYVMNLSPQEKADIVLDLNLDMLGSPNFIRGLYNGSTAPEKVVNESVKIHELLSSFLNASNTPYDLIPMSGGSDYLSFIQQGVDIPAGGVATGAGGLKTVEERCKYGGLADAQLDTCYHQSCDTIDNVDAKVYVQMAGTIAHALETLMSAEDIRGYLKTP